MISVTERTGYIHRIRELARLVATEYLLSREKLGFPLINHLAPKEEAILEPLLPLSPSTFDFNKDKKRDFLFEIGTEQLPA